MSEQLPAQPACGDGLRLENLRAVMPSSAECVDGRLFIGGVDMDRLARERGTALFVMDEAHIQNALTQYREGMSSGKAKGLVVYAGKAFCCVAMDKLVDQEGCCLDVSGGELAVALAAGFPAERIFVHGNNKSVPEIRDAVKAGVGCFVVDTLDELDRISAEAIAQGVVQKILLRITPGVLADTHSFVQTGSEDSKFGFCADNGMGEEALVKALSLDGIEVFGFHMHIGSQIFALDCFARAIEVMTRFMADMREKHGFVAECLDLGGGLGVAYTHDENPTPIPKFCEYVLEQVEMQCEKLGLELPTVCVEPGRSIVANAGVTLYTVGSVKEIPSVRTYVAVDGGMSDNIRTPLYGSKYEAVIADKADLPRDFVGTVVGKHCESGDVVIANASLQDPKPGDVLCVFGTGAYCQTMSSNYNKQVRPAVVFVRDGLSREVVRRETYDDLLRCEVMD